MLIPVLLAVALVSIGAALNAYGAALVSVDRRSLEDRAGAGRRSAAHALGLLERPGLDLVEVRLGVFLATLGLGATIEPMVDRLVGEPSGAMTDPSRGWTVLLSLLVAIGAHVVLGEMVATSIGAQRPVGTLRTLSVPFRALSALLLPLARVGDAIARRSLALLGTDSGAVLSRIRSRAELRRLLQQSERSGAIAPGDAALFDRTLRFADKCAADAFTPRVEVVSLDGDATVADLVERSRATGYSRFPVRGEDLDDVLGVVHVKDVLGVPAGRRAVMPVTELLRPVHAVPESKDLDTLMSELRAADGQFAVVVDEYGGTAGIITLEDLIEEIVGDISDEHDSAASVPPVRRWGGAHLLSGSLHPDEVRDACDLAMPEGDYETLAGFVMSELGHVPEEGERFVHEGWELEVVHMDGHRVRTVKLVAPSPGAQDLVDPTEGDA